jgi:uncharacterized YokU family protein
MNCMWCSSSSVEITKDTVYWELPDGTRAIEISDTPSVFCNECGMVYQEEGIIEKIEDQLFLIDTKKIAKKIDYDTLMKQPRILKKNYFKYTD